MRAIAAFIAAVRAAGVDVDAYSIAEILWLAERVSPRDERPEPGVAASVRVAGTPALSRTLEIERALRQLRRFRPSQTSFLLDTERTARRSLEFDMPFPVMCPACEPWFEVALVTDVMPPLFIWRETLVEFSQILKRSGAFRDVRRWTLCADVDAIALEAESGSRQDPRAIAERCARRLILIATDGVAAHWHDARMWRTIAAWARTTPTAFVQLLPERLWTSTAIDGTLATASSLLPGAPNTALHIRRQWWSSRDGGSPAIAFPVLSLEPASIAAWANVMMGASGSIPATVGPSQDDERKGFSMPEHLSAEERIRRFMMLASPAAFQLAVYISALPSELPLVLPVMRLVQVTMQKSSDASHLAEFVYSGLIKRAKDEADGVIAFEFQDDVRPLLQRRMRVGEAHMLERALFHPSEARAERHTLSDEPSRASRPDAPLARDGAVLVKSSATYITGDSSDSGSSERRINVWISERVPNIEAPLRALQHYTLNVSVGARVAESLVPNAVPPITESDVPPGGLATTWIFACSGARLSTITAGTRVSKALYADAPSSATFDLLIPARGPSDVIQLALMPLYAGEILLHALIYVGSELYREFDVRLNSVASDARTRTGAPAGSFRPLSIAANEYAHAPLAETGLAFHHDWASPPGALTIAVFGQNAYVSGTVGDKVIGTLHPWTVTLATVAASIEAARRATERFRAQHERYLDNVDACDFLERIEKWEPAHWADLNSADADHVAAWDIVSRSEELRELAYAGHALYQAFFPPESELQKTLDAAPVGTRISIFWSPESGPGHIPNVPWGLMYVPGMPPIGDPIDPIGFMALRFRLDYRAHATSASIEKAPSKALGNAASVHRAHLLYWGDDKGDATSAEALWQREEWRKMSNVTLLPDATGLPKQRLVSMLHQPSPQPTSVLYMYCRYNLQNGTEPLLGFGNGSGADETIKRSELGSIPFADEPLVFANACMTAAADAYKASELERIFFLRRCRAYVGTETKVPITFASRFGVLFFRIFYRQVVPEPIAAGEAFAQTRLFFWTHYRNVGGIFYTYVNQYDLFMADTTEILAART